MEITIATILEIYQDRKNIEPIFSSRTYIPSNYYGGLINIDSGELIVKTAPIYLDSSKVIEAMNKLKAKIIAIIGKYGDNPKEAILAEKKAVLAKLEIILGKALGESVSIVSSKSIRLKNS